MKVIAFNGSPRADGNTRLLLEHVLQPLRARGIHTEMIQLGGSKIHSCRNCYGCRKTPNARCAYYEDDTANAYIAKMMAADGIIIGSPTNYKDPSPETRALIERAGSVAAANGHPFKHKVGAAVIAVRRAGEIHALDAINHFFLMSQMIVPGSSYWNVGVGEQKGDVLNDAQALTTMRVLGENMAWLLENMPVGMNLPPMAPMPPLADHAYHQMAFS